MASWLITHWPYVELRKKLPTLHERPMTNAFVWFAAFLFPFWLALFALTLWGTFSLWFTEPPSGENQALAYRIHYLALVGLMTALAGLIGAPLAIHRLYTVERQTKAQEEGLITDRINKSVEGLGAEKTVSRMGRNISFVTRDNNNEITHDVFEWRDEPLQTVRTDLVGAPQLGEWTAFSESHPNIEVRIGAVYALERIAQDSLRDHIQIMEILCAYIRQNAAVRSLEPNEPPFDRAIPRADIQAAVSVIGRRTAQQKQIEKSARFRLDLRNTNLAGIDFSEGDFSAAMFHHCRLEASIFRNCDLAGTEFFHSLLNFADFLNANLYGTRFDLAIINRPYRGTGAIGPTIANGNIYGISIAGANMPAINYLGKKEKLHLVFGSRDTVLDHSLHFDADAIESIRDQILIAKEEGRSGEARRLQKQLDETDFSHWCPYDMNDLLFNKYYYDFLDSLHITGWPYR